MTGLFITFEGTEGSGKSTQIPLLADRLRAMGRHVRTLREPGGTPIGEIIRPSLAAGEIILSDRFYDSTTAYQGYGRQLDLKMVESIINAAVGETRPDLTLLFLLPYDVAEARRVARQPTLPMTLQRDRI